MTAPYSMDLRERAMARKAAGETNREIAAALRIAPSCVSKWTKRERETGSLAPGQVGGYKPRTLSGDCAQWLRERIASGAVESPPGTDRTPTLGVHRRDLGEDQHGAPARLGTSRATAEGLRALRPL